MTIFRVSSINFELFEWFGNNSPQIFTINVHHTETIYWAPVLTTLVWGQGSDYIWLKFCIPSKTFEPFEGFWNNSLQMLTILIRCAERCYNDFGSRLRSQITGLMTVFRVCSITFELFKEFWKNSPQMLTILRGCARAHVTTSLVQGQCCNMTIFRVRSITFELFKHPSLEYI